MNFDIKNRVKKLQEEKTARLQRTIERTYKLIGEAVAAEAEEDPEFAKILKDILLQRIAKKSNRALMGLTEEESASPS